MVGEVSFGASGGPFIRFSFRANLAEAVDDKRRVFCRAVIAV